MTVMWWDALDFMELQGKRFWEAHICATDPHDTWTASSHLRLETEKWAGAHVAGRDDADIITNLLSDPRTFARKEMIS
jgi:hypothetical protein